MDYVIVKKVISGDDEHRQNLIDYVSDDRKLTIGGNGVDYTNPEAVLNQMEYVSEYHEKTHCCPMVQIVLALDESVKDPDTACRYVEEAAKIIDTNYQSMYCAHQPDPECNRFHGHIILNPVNASTGRILDTNRSFMDHFCDQVEEITGNETRAIFKRNTNK